MNHNSPARGAKSVAEIWYAIEAYENGIIRFREDHIDTRFA